MVENKSVEVTVFTIPKPFTGHIGIIQRNAVKNWTECGFTVILFGNEPGVKETAEEFGATHYPNVSVNERGTPYLNEVFLMATVGATTPLLCYANADILFPDGFSTAIAVLMKKIPNGFLVTGERLNYEVPGLIQGSTAAIREDVLRNHTHDLFSGLDYFLFPRGMIRKMPPFVVGRAGWDNWLIYDTRRRRIPVVDASECILTVHQKHDYNHIKEKTWKNSPESKENLRLVKNRYLYLWELADANYRMDKDGVITAIQSYRIPLTNLILATPERWHFLLEPVYRAGHYLKWAYLKAKPI